MLDEENESEIKLSYKELEEEIKKNETTKEELYKWFRDELDKRDEIIKKLKTENALLFKTALKSQEHIIASKIKSSKPTSESTNTE